MMSLDRDLFLERAEQKLKFCPLSWRSGCTGLAFCESWSYLFIVLASGFSTLMCVGCLWFSTYPATIGVRRYGEHLPIALFWFGVTALLFFGAAFSGIASIRLLLRWLWVYRVRLDPDGITLTCRLFCSRQTQETYLPKSQLDAVFIVKDTLVSVLEIYILTNSADAKLLRVAAIVSEDGIDRFAACWRLAPDYCEKEYRALHFRG